jgi:hypothetical protein
MPVVARRRRRAAESVPTATDTAVDDAATEADAAAGAALRLAREALGHEARLAGAAEPVLGWGSHAHRVRLVVDDPAWGAPLVVRSAGAGAAANERRWIDALGAADFPVPTLLAHDRTAGSLVFREPDGVPLAERMFAEMMALPRLLAGFGRLHARLHAVAVNGAGDGDGDGIGTGDDRSGDDGTGLFDALAATAEDDEAVGAELGPEVARLAAHTPAPADRVICHGELNPVQVYSRGEPGDGGHGDDGHGDDGEDDGTVSVPVNWAGAGTGDAEMDVAATLTGFWSGALYIDNLVQRRMYRMARDPLASGYLAGYRAAAPRALDEDRVRYWQAFHVCRLGAGIARCARRGPDGPWDPAAAVVNPRAALDEIRSRARELLPA